MARIRVNNKKGWLIVMSIFVLNFFIFGIIHAFSLVFVNLQREFNATATTLGSIGSVTSAAVSFMTPISCLLYELTSHRSVSIIGVFLCSIGVLTSSFVNDVRLLMLTFSFIYGTGANFLYNPLFNLVSYYFPEKQSARVTSLGSAGASLGALTLTPLMNMLFPLCGWRVLFQCYSGVIFVIGLACCKPLSSPPQIHIKSPKNERRASNKDNSNIRNKYMKYICILKTWEHWLFNFGVAFGASAVFFYLFFLVSVVESFDISSEKASTQVIILSAAQILGRGFCVLFGDKLPVSRPMALAINSIIGAASSVLLFFNGSYTQIAVSTSVTGFAIGFYFSLIYAAGIEVFGLERNSESVAYTIISIGLSTLTIPFLYGTSYDNTGSYSISILTSTIVWILSSVFFTFTTIYHKRLSRRFQSLNNTSSIDHKTNDTIGDIRLRLENEAEVGEELL
ncbi:monocarboxylate transporter 1-like [Antedon mediterranea]|uniref:monocarboxylate transporter 1-like n=1 Tax=Antedon mediterranea TaxID=105859 RepID=UPI003AF6774D